MKRLLLIGKQLPRLEYIDWNSSLTHNIVDYQGLLFDCRTMGDFAAQQVSLSQVLQRYLQAGHSVYIIVPDLKGSEQHHFQLQLLPNPYTFTVERAQGRTIKLVHELPFYRAYMGCLQGHEIVTTPHFGPQHAPHLTPTVTDNLGRMICGYIQLWKGHIFLLHPPSRAKEVEAFNIIVDEFKPDFVEPELQAPPDWASKIVAALPGISEIEKSIGELKSQVAGLESQIDSHLEKKQQIEKWAELLWLDGIPFQNRVREAFDFLGFQTESQNATGHTHDLVLKHNGYTFYAEVTGSTGSIKIDKGRELLQWIIDSPSPEKIRGVLIANAFRSLPPDGRPPSANHKVFTAELEQLANRYDFALLDVRELMRLVTAKLENKSLDLETICKRMSGKGAVPLIDQTQAAPQ